MKKMQKGFTLVELIVVITILAILGTIAFISLQGYSQDARDSKAISDVRTLASAVETRLSEGYALSGMVTTDADNAVTVGTYAGGTALGASGATDAGTINFTGLGQNGEDFGDDYRIGTLSNSTRTVTKNGEDVAVTDRMYQVVGVTGPADSHKAVVKGNYLYESGDMTGLVSEGITATTTGLTDGATVANTKL